MKMPDVVVSNDAAWTALEAIDYSKKVMEAFLRQHYKDGTKQDFYSDSAKRAIDLCDKAKALWRKKK